jgi:hypothetical protein
MAFAMQHAYDMRWGLHRINEAKTRKELIDPALERAGSGPGVVLGSPEQSTLVTRQSGSSPHFGQLTPDELALVTQWIQAGAPEK